MSSSGAGGRFRLALDCKARVILDKDRELLSTSTLMVMMAMYEMR